MVPRRTSHVAVTLAITVSFLLSSVMGVINDISPLQLESDDQSNQVAEPSYFDLEIEALESINAFQRFDESELDFSALLGSVSGIENLDFTLQNWGSAEEDELALQFLLDSTEDINTVPDESYNAQFFRTPVDDTSLVSDSIALRQLELEGSKIDDIVEQPVRLFDNYKPHQLPKPKQTRKRSRVPRTRPRALMPKPESKLESEEQQQLKEPETQQVVQQQEQHESPAEQVRDRKRQRQIGPIPTINRQQLESERMELPDLESRLEADVQKHHEKGTLVQQVEQLHAQQKINESEMQAQQKMASELHSDMSMPLDRMRTSSTGRSDYSPIPSNEHQQAEMSPSSNGPAPTKEEIVAYLTKLLVLPKSEADLPQQQPQSPVRAYNLSPPSQYQYSHVQLPVQQQPTPWYIANNQKAILEDLERLPKLPILRPPPPPEPRYTSRSLTADQIEILADLDKLSERRMTPKPLMPPRQQQPLRPPPPLQPPSVIKPPSPIQLPAPILSPSSIQSPSPIQSPPPVKSRSRQRKGFVFADMNAETKRRHQEGKRAPAKPRPRAKKNVDGKNDKKETVTKNTNKNNAEMDLYSDELKRHLMRQLDSVKSSRAVVEDESSSTSMTEAIEVENDADVSNNASTNPSTNQSSNQSSRKSSTVMQQDSTERVPQETPMANNPSIAGPVGFTRFERSQNAAETLRVLLDRFYEHN